MGIHQRHICVSFGHLIIFFVCRGTTFSSLSISLEEEEQLFRQTNSMDLQSFPWKFVCFKRFVSPNGTCLCIMHTEWLVLYPWKYNTLVMAPYYINYYRLCLFFNSIFLVQPKMLIFHVSRSQWEKPLVNS